MTRYLCHSWSQHFLRTFRANIYVVLIVPRHRVLVGGAIILEDKQKEVCSRNVSRNHDDIYNS